MSIEWKFTNGKEIYSDKFSPDEFLAMYIKIGTLHHRYQFDANNVLWRVMLRNLEAVKEVIFSGNVTDDEIEDLAITRLHDPGSKVMGKDWLSFIANIEQDERFNTLPEIVRIQILNYLFPEESEED